MMSMAVTLRDGVTEVIGLLLVQGLSAALWISLGRLPWRRDSPLASGTRQPFGHRSAARRAGSSPQTGLPTCRQPITLGSILPKQRPLPKEVLTLPLDHEITPLYMSLAGLSFTSRTQRPGLRASVSRAHRSTSGTALFCSRLCVTASWMPGPSMKRGAPFLKIWSQPAPPICPGSPRGSMCSDCSSRPTCTRRTAQSVSTLDPAYKRSLGSGILSFPQAEGIWPGCGSPYLWHAHCCICYGMVQWVAVKLRSVAPAHPQMHRRGP